MSLLEKILFSKEKYTLLLVVLSFSQAKRFLVRLKMVQIVTQRPLERGWSLVMTAKSKPLSLM